MITASEEAIKYEKDDLRPHSCIILSMPGHCYDSAGPKSGEVGVTQHLAG